tara:strand:- start:65 stop:697 length:633 start_codon:yes stop_codon:yes gene_type:complete
MSKYQRKQASGKIRINDDAYIYMRSDNVRADVYYFRISKQPHWRKPYVKSLRTTNKEIALEMAMKEYDEVMEQQRVVQATIFNEEDVQLATSQAGIGKLGEDRFTGIMMIKGYQVYKPEMDLWGRDLILYKDDKFMPTQVKTAVKNNNQWQFQTKHSSNRIKYKEVCTHMAFIHIVENRIWFIPTDKLPDVDSMAHSKFKSYLEGYEVVL